MCRRSINPATMDDMAINRPDHLQHLKNSFALPLSTSVGKITFILVSYIENPLIGAWVLSSKYSIEEGLLIKERHLFEGGHLYQ